MAINHRLKQNKPTPRKITGEHRCNQCLEIKPSSEFHTQKTNTFSKENPHRQVTTCADCIKKRKRQSLERRRKKDQEITASTSVKLDDTMVTESLRKSLGHTFSGDDLSCTNVDCGKDFYEHQKNPSTCGKQKRNISLDRALKV